MKLLSAFIDLGTLTASGEAAGFDVENIEGLEPMIRWKADAYAGDVWVKADLGSAKALTALFLNRCNFVHCHIQGNASDSWASPAFDMGVDLVLDDAGNRKGWYELESFSYQWLRILIPSGQTLDNSETLPAIGNLIVGVSADLPLVSSLDHRLIQRQDRFEADGGALEKSNRGRARHIITIACGDELANIRTMPKTWTMGVIYADLANASEAWLVFPPDDWSRPIRSMIEAEIRFTLEEKP